MADNDGVIDHADSILRGPNDRPSDSGVIHALQLLFGSIFAARGQAGSLRCVLTLHASMVALCL